MKNAAGIGLSIIIFALGLAMGLAIDSSFFPDPHNPPALSWVPVGIAGTLLFTGISMILGSDLDNNDPQDRVLIGRPPITIVERKPE